MLKSSSSEKKLVKPLKNCFLDPICIEKGSLWTTPKTKKQIISFQKVFILSKYHMFWLSYESFSILSHVFCQKKCYFQWKQLCARHKPIIWCYKRSFSAQKYTLPGINSYEKILEKSDLYTYLFLITENTMIWI